MTSSSVITRAELRMVGRLLLGVLCAVVISVLGILLTLETSSRVIGWILVPGGMLAIENMRMNDYAAFWFLGGIVLNLTLWTIVFYAVTDMVSDRRRRRAAA